MTQSRHAPDPLDAIRIGDKKAFDLFFLRHYSILCGYAGQFVATDDAEEIVQDVMVWLWENRDNIVIQTTLIQYLFRSVRNKCINHIHKERLKEKVFHSLSIHQETLFDDPDCYVVEELSRKIEESLNGLPESYREAFILSRIDGKTYNEIASLLQVSSKTIDYRIQQALKILRVQLKDYLPLLLPFL
ncbi:MAG: RNA polymerase sigma-70 factor [Tannerellaceae bacterium]|nr:RNA polymerase sigma-70 factor [Tannerellaceae bacterium]